MAVSERAAREARILPDIDGLVASVLDALPLTERAYHHLAFSRPLAAALLQSAAAANTTEARVLLVGGNALLGHCLLELGFAPEIWQFPQSYLTEELQRHIGRVVTPETLMEAVDAIDVAYDLIILPLVLESAPVPASDLLGRLKAALAPGGTLLLALRNSGRLEARLAGLANRAEASASDGYSFSWPLLPVRHAYRREEIAGAARDAGLRVRRQAFVTAEEAFLLMEPLNVLQYSSRKLAHALKRTLPPARDVVLFELTARSGDTEPTLPAGGERPMVSVVVPAADHQALASTLPSLLDQTYPAERYELILLRCPDSPDPTDAVATGVAGNGRHRVRQLVLPRAEGPAARNRALETASGEIIALTDGACRLPPDWIESAVSWFDTNTAVVAGPVFADAGSAPDIFDAPASRPVDRPPYRGEEHDGVLFPAANSFYRRSAALAAGGFDESYDRDNGVRLGWDSELAWRLRRGGWKTRFREEVYAFRSFPQPGRLRWIADQLRKAEELPLLVAAIPELRQRLLTGQLFASKQTLYFDLALAGAGSAALRRRAAWLLLGVPWLMSISSQFDAWPPSGWKSSARSAARLGIRQCVWLAGYVKGSIRARRPVL